MPMRWSLEPMPPLDPRLGREALYLDLAYVANCANYLRQEWKKKSQEKKTGETAQTGVTGLPGSSGPVRP